MLYAAVESQSFFISLCWPLLEEFWENQNNYINQDKLLKISKSDNSKMLMCAPFMWGSEQETVQECLWIIYIIIYIYIYHLTSVS